MAVQDCDYAFVLDHPKMRLPDADKDIDTHPVKVGRLPLRPCMPCQQRMSSHLMQWPYHTPLYMYAPQPSLLSQRHNISLCD